MAGYLAVGLSVQLLATATAAPPTLDGPFEKLGKDLQGFAELQRGDVFGRGVDVSGHRAHIHKLPSGAAVSGSSSASAAAGPAAASGSGSGSAAHVATAVHKAYKKKAEAEEAHSIVGKPAHQTADKTVATKKLDKVESQKVVVEEAKKKLQEKEQKAEEQYVVVEEAKRKLEKKKAEEAKKKLEAAKRRARKDSSPDVEVGQSRPQRVVVVDDWFPNDLVKVLGLIIIVILMGCALCCCGRVDAFTRAVAKERQTVSYPREHLVATHASYCPARGHDTHAWRSTDVDAYFDPGVKHWADETALHSSTGSCTICGGGVCISCADGVLEVRPTPPRLGDSRRHYWPQ